MSKRFPIYLMLGLIMASFIVSCKDGDTVPVIPSSNVAITSFKLGKNDSVLKNLDSIFFTIDLNRAEIFNADSLPKGTDVSKITVSITYPICQTAQFTVTGGKIMKDTTFNYSSETTDSIDFTGNVRFKLVSEDGLESRSYTLKVNVHNMKADSLYWNRTARRDLPSRWGSPKAQKTTEARNLMACLIEEVNGEFTLATIEEPSVGTWDINAVTFGFTPNIDTFTGTDDKYYILDQDGLLYESNDGLSWTSTGAVWFDVSGSYDDVLLGVVKDGDVYKHDEMPRRYGYISTEVEEGFPITGASQMILFDEQWSSSPKGFIIGGKDKDGNYIGDTWGFDGDNWGKISNTTVPPKVGMTLFPYFSFKTNTSNWTSTQYTTLFAVGGYDEYNVPSKKVYISLDMGLNWKVADDEMQLPEYINPMAYAQAFIYYTTLTTTRSTNSWLELPSRELPVWCSIVPTSQTKAITPIVDWECPYVYIFGGMNDSGQLENNIWRGVINRLSFKPIQ